MANTYFKFKQFTVNQEHCAMKVCTDACLQGAYTAHYLASTSLSKPAPAILDIGAGTGLLSLMLAQQVQANITAVELDTDAARQAAANFAASPWPDRLSVMQQDIRAMQGKQTFNFIISNPPFYEAALKRDHVQKDLAMHATSLNYKELAAAIGRQLMPSGQVSIMLPYTSFTGFRVLMQTAGYYLQAVLYVRQSINHNYFRAIGIFGKMQVQTLKKDIAIHDNGNVYTTAFAALLRPYYLYL